MQKGEELLRGKPDRALWGWVCACTGSGVQGPRQSGPGGLQPLCTGGLKWGCAGCLAAPGVRGEGGGVLVPLDRVTKEPGRQQLWQGAAYKA